jgi:hypothetical protein
MPRRLKRKGQKETPGIETFMRDGNPTWFEIEGEPDPAKREARQHACRLARDELLRVYREWKRGTLPPLDFRVRFFCEQWIAENDGRLPSPLNTGRPADEHHRLLIAVHVKEAIEARGGKRGSVEAALREVAERHRLSYDQVRDIHYDRDPEWRHVVAVELVRRKLEVESDR